MKYSPQTMLCALLVVATYVLVATRAGLLAFAPALACAVTIGAMIGTVVRPGRPGRR